MLDHVYILIACCLRDPITIETQGWPVLYAFLGVFRLVEGPECFRMEMVKIWLQNLSKSGLNGEGIGGLVFGLVGVPSLSSHSIVSFLILANYEGGGTNTR